MLVVELRDEVAVLLPGGRDLVAADRQDAVAFKNAAKECAAERERLGDDDFAEEYGRNANDRNAFGKCVSKKARENEAEQPEG